MPADLIQLSQTLPPGTPTLAIISAGGALGVFIAVIVGVLLVGMAGFIIFKGLSLTFRFIAHVFRVVGAIIADLARALGAIVLTLVLVPLVILNIVIGRWSAASHFGRAVQDETLALGACLYRVLIGHPARLIGLGHMTEGLEKRLPRIVAEAPTRDRPARASGLFDGYRIVGSLAGGGSGGKLYVAEPDEARREMLRRRGCEDVDQVVIKVFSLGDGSSLPQIVRESRALDAARRLGLVFEHELTDDRFYYVMRYVPGESLSQVIRRQHAHSGPEGLSADRLRETLGYIADLVRALDTYHRGGLWHKDVKPDNVIVDRTGAHLVDFGLITPLRSAMTLTTHGTEYFRDPELVRMALRGVKVHQIDGAKFDVYGAGAVLFAAIEDSFPAHGGLSRVTRRCPEAVRWIIRRAMAEYDQRYSSARAMLADLETVLQAPDPFALRPIDLPSMRGASAPDDLEPEQAEAVRHEPAPAGMAAGVGAGARAGFVAGRRTAPALMVTDWFSGRYKAVDRSVRRSPAPPVAPGRGGRRHGASAREQVTSARKRAEACRRRAMKRAEERRRRVRRVSPGSVNAGMVASALFVFFGVTIVLGLLLFAAGSREARVAASSAPVADVPPAPGVAPGSAGRMLVVSDLRPPLEPAVRDRLQLSFGRMAASGVELTGDLAALRPEAASELAPDAEVELLARVRRLRGQTPLDAPELLDALRPAVVADGEPGLDYVLWIAPGEDAERVSYALVSRAGGHAGMDVGRVAERVGRAR